MANQDIYEAVLKMDKQRVPNLVKAELDAGTDVLSILNDGLIAALDEVGKRFSEGSLFVPEMLLAARVMSLGLDLLRPVLAETGVKPKGTVVIGTVKGDLHDIGKNVVAMMLEGSGFKVVDLGVDVSADKFAEAAKENQADLVALSSLLTTTMRAMEEIVSTLKHQGNGVKILVGGAPVTQKFANDIGADGHGLDAPGGVMQARKLLGI